MEVVNATNGRQAIDILKIRAPYHRVLPGGRTAGNADWKELIVK
jgi:hypothetical protein